MPDGHVFLLGDSQDHSEDSRSFGPVHLRDVVGIAKQVWLNRAERLARTGVWLGLNG